MTIVNIEQEDKRDVYPPDIITGNWYEIVQYNPNPNLIGEIGVGYRYLNRNDDTTYEGIVSPNGTFYNHDKIVYRQIKKITIIKE